MRLERFIFELQRMIEEVPESDVEEYKYFSLPKKYKKFDYHLTESFPGYYFEYFSDELMRNNFYLKNHSFFL